LNSDITTLREQSKLTFKQKKVLIQLLTNRSKDYLIRLVSRYGMQDYKLLLSDESLFGKFLILLAMPTKDIELEHLQKSLGGIGMNEIAVGILISIKDSTEIKELCDAFYKRYKCSLLSKIQSKLRKDSCNHTFFTTILSNDRDTSPNTDLDAANNIVEKLTPLFRSKSITSEDADLVITTLCCTSREQCKVIASNYHKANGSSLENAINSVLPKSIAIALNLWILPIGDAFTYLLSNTPDNENIVYYIAQYDKVFLQDQVQDSDRKRQFISTLQGNYKAAVESWLLEPYSNTPDLGYIDRIRTYIRDQRNLTGMTLEEITADKSREQYGLIKFYLEEAITSLKEFAARNVSSSPEGTDGKLIHSLHKKKSNAHPDDHHQIHMEYVEKLKLVTGYLRLQFDTYDEIGDGVLDSTEFWQFFNVIPLEHIGMTPEEISLIKSETTEWDENGNISFDEVCNELADYIINSLDQENGKSFEEKIDDLYNEASSSQQSVKRSRKETTTVNSSDGPVRNNGSLAPDLLSYLQVTFAEYDTDESGTLDWDEFWKLLQAMNLGVTESDYEVIMNEFDTSGDGKVNWSEAIKQFNKIIHDLASDARDHWIGLVDKEFNKLFWYNIRDGSSSWMNEEDQAAYGAATHKEYVLPSVKIKSKKYSTRQSKKHTPKSNINHWLISDDIDPSK